MFFARPARKQNRRLALLLFVEAVGWGTGAGLLYLVEDPANGYGIQAIFHMSLLALPWLYLRFLATLDVPTTRLLRGRVSEALLVAGALGGPMLYLLRPGKYTITMVEAWYTPVEAVLGPWFDQTLLLGGVASLYGLAAAVSAVRAADVGPARDRARSYALAFGVRDAIIITIFFVLPTAFPLPPSGAWTDLLYIWGSPVATLSFALLASYGILRTQLFNIDLRIKWTLQKSTVAAIFVAVFFVVSEGAQILFADFADSEFLGVLAAGALVFFLAPLQRMAESVADAAMPGVEDTEEYREERKREVYQAALESAVEDEEITDKERDMLARLQDELGLTGQDALELEREILDSSGGEPA